MELFTWDNKYSLGRSDLDSEHQALFRMAEHLYNAIGQGTSQDELIALFARLTAYARFHFENEEALMRKTGFPDYEQYRREHAAVTAKIALLDGELQAGVARVDTATMEFLQNWLQDHVCGTDIWRSIFKGRKEEAL